MRIGDLSQLSGVTSASIKFYVREGLLHPAERTGYNQSEYDDSHVRRLRLIRSLIEVGGLTVDAARRVLTAADDPQTPIETLLATAHHAGSTSEAEPSDAARDTIENLAQKFGWIHASTSPGFATAAAVLDAYRELGLDELTSLLEPYASAADAAARAEVAVAFAAETPAKMAEIVAVGTILGDSLLAGLRRLAQQSAALRAGMAAGTIPAIAPDLPLSSALCADTDPTTSQEGTS